MKQVLMVYAYGSAFKDRSARDLMLVWTQPIGKAFFKMLDKHRDELGIWDGVGADELAACYERDGMRDVNTRLDLGGVEIVNANEWGGC